MTDNINTSVDLEQLLKDYEAGVASPSGETAWLKARSTLEAQMGTLSTAQFKRVEKADRALATRADEIAKQHGEKFKAVRDEYPTDHWWWYLDFVSAAVPAIAPKPPSQTERLVNNILNIVLLAALLGAGFLFVQRSGLITIPTPAPTRAPSSTPLPTVTLNAAAFPTDFAAGSKPFTTEFGVFKMNVPDGWVNESGSSLDRFQFLYGDPQQPRAGLIIFFEKATDVYQRLSLTGEIKTADEAMTQFKNNITAQAAGQGLTIGDVFKTKIGANEASGIIYTQPAAPGAEAQETELRYALIPNSDKGVLVAIQGESGVWTQVKDVTYKMIESIEIKPENIPTATPTSTLHPLLITATAVQTQIIGLTPTATHTPTLTVTPGGTAEATAEATSAATAEATSEATAAATSEATAEATAEAPAATPVPPTVAPTTAPTTAATPEATAEATQEATATVAP
jgi:hypothetical protein